MQPKPIAETVSPSPRVRFSMLFSLLVVVRSGLADVLAAVGW
jgi:hypothetical protein